MNLFIKITLLLIFFQANVSYAQVCPFGQHWVKAHSRRAYYRADGTFVKATFVKAYCKGNPQSYDVWHQKIRHERPENWSHSKELIGAWSTEEIEWTIEALDELPQELWSGKVKGVYRMKRSQDFPNPASSIDGAIVLYDTAFSGDKKNRPLTRVLAHELAHQKYLDLSEDDRSSYHMATNWMVGKSKKTGRDLYFSRSDGFVQDDGKNTPLEDFANNIEFFLFEPTVLKSKTPHAYRWIKEHFGDKFKVGEK